MIQDLEKIIEYIENNLHEYALCIDGDDKSFRYMIASRYTGDDIPEGIKILKKLNSWQK